MKYVPNSKYGVRLYYKYDVSIKKRIRRNKQSGIGILPKMNIHVYVYLVWILVVCMRFVQGTPFLHVLYILYFHIVY